MFNSVWYEGDPRKECFKKVFDSVVSVVWRVLRQCRTDEPVLLDVGADVGQLAVALRRVGGVGFRYVAVELDGRKEEVLKEVADEVVMGDWFAIRMVGKADVVVMSFFLDAVSKDRWVRALRLARLALRDAGKVVVTVTNSKHPAVRITKALGIRSASDASKEEFEVLAWAAGLRVEYVERVYADVPFSLLPNWRLRIRALERLVYRFSKEPYVYVYVLGGGVRG